MLDEKEAKGMFEVARHKVGDETYEPLDFAELDARQFLTEYCWVVFESGFRYTVVREKFPAIKDAVPVLRPGVSREHGSRRAG